MSFRSSLLADLHATKYIDVSYNDLREIPVFNDSAQTLVDLNLRNNDIRTLRVGDFYIFDALSVLNMKDNELRTLPNHSWVDNDNNLTGLNINITLITSKTSSLP